MVWCTHIHHPGVLPVYHSKLIVQVYIGMVYISINTVFSVLLYRCTIEWCTSPSTVQHPVRWVYTSPRVLFVQVYNGMVYNSIFTVLILHVYNGMVYISIITVFSEYITVYLFYRSMMVWWTSPSSHCVYHVYPRVHIKM